MSDIVASNETILVVGGGISGMTAALEAAECGKGVILVEKKPSLGGRVSQLHKYFPKLCRPSCGQEINYRRIKANRHFRVITMTEVEAVSGDSGDYSVTLKTTPRYVNDNCTACGACAEAVSAEIDNPHNYNMDKIKAAYIPHNMAFPQQYVLDSSIVGTEEGEKAKAACEVDAIDLGMQEASVDIKCGAIIWATGWTPYDAAKIQPYGYEDFANVITNVEFERMMDAYGPTGGKLLRPSDGKEAKDIAFIQCAGSRDRNHLLHCSRICCMASLKQCTYLGEQYGDDTDVKGTVYYIDIRTIDRLEDFERKVREDERIGFVKSKVANIKLNPENDSPICHGVDTEGYHRFANEHDLVVLAVGMDPNAGTAKIADGVVTDDGGFIQLAPENGGIFAAGCASDALDVNRAVQNATAAALRAIQVVNRVAAADAA
jgi:quinone-modifying oxidoreductase subunit QmoA